MIPTSEAFTQWGWRVGFIASIVLVLYGLYVRRRLSESPLFEQAAAKQGTASVPVFQVLRRYPAGVLVAIFATAASPAFGYMVLTYVLSYGTKEVGYSRNALLIVIIVTSVFQFVATLVLAAIADRWGRRRMMLVGSVFQAGAALAFFPIFDTGVIVLAMIGCSVAMVANTAQYAPLPAVMSDLFPTNLRYSGSSIGYQFGSIIGGSLSPIIATAIYAGTQNSLLIGVYLAGMTVLSAIAILLAHTPTLISKVAATEKQLTTSVS